MSDDDTFRFWKFVHDLQRMPRMSETNCPAPKLSNEALCILTEHGLNTLEVHNLKIKLEDVEENRVTLALAFCDKDDNPIVNIGRYTLVGYGAVMTIVKIANSLNFNIT